MSTGDIAAFDPSLTQKLARLWLPILERYYRVQYRGLENIPEIPFLGVGNHLGMYFMPESYIWGTKYHSEERKVPMLTLIHHLFHHVAEMLKMPVDDLGLLEATRQNALDALKKGFAVTLYPGGDRDNSKPFKDRNRIDFFDHLG